MLASNFKLRKFELVTIVVPAGSGDREFYFPDQPNLRNARILTIATYNGYIIPLDPNNIATMTVDDLRQSYLILNINDKEDVKIPMVILSNLANPQATSVNVSNTVNGYLPFAGQVVTWSKSYVKFPNGHNAGQFSIMLGVFYE